MDSPASPTPNLTGLIRLLPAAGVLALWIALMPAHGGYFARDWSPAGLAVLGLWLVAVASGGRLLPPGRTAKVALLALAGLGAFAYLSILWADAAGTAWGTANQYATVVFAVWTLSLLPWTAAAAQALMGIFGVAAAVVLFVALVTTPGKSDLAFAFIEHRWAEPVGYPNGLGNFGFFAAIPLIAISASPARSLLIKAPALGIATLLAGCALLPQSRGSLLAVIVTVPILIALSPRRWRTTSRVVVVAAALAAASGPIFDVFEALRDEKTVVSPALEDAARAIALASIAAMVAGALLALVESQLAGRAVAERVARISGYAVAGLIVLGLAGAAVVNADRIQNVAEKERDAWNNPRERFVDHEVERSSRLLNPDPLQRYEYWHISLDALGDNPLGGLGAGGFEKRYTKERAFLKYAAFPHSLFMRTAAEAGVPGILGVIAFVAAVLLGLLGRWRRADDEQRTVIAAALAAVVLFTVHAQLDWLEEFPALAGPALAFLLVAMRVGRPGDEGEHRDRRHARLRVAGAAALALVVGLSVLSPYVALRYRERADATWRTEPERAYSDLRRAADLDPLSDTPLLSEGTIALQKRDYRRARAAFEAALERDETWLPHFELALIEAAEGDERAAMRQLDVATALNPLEPAIPAAREEIREGEGIDPVRLNRRLFESPLFNPPRLT